MSLLNAADQLLSHHRPRKVPGRRFLSRSAVCMLLNENHSSGLQVLMIKRAEKHGDPWSGHMAFPGGRMDKNDDSILSAALRELDEEVGVDGQQQCTYMGRLSDLVTKAHVTPKPMIVTPFVFRADQSLDFTINEEVDEIVWVPLAFIADQQKRETMRWRTAGVNVRLPCYFYEGRRIWGLSLAMLDELVALMSAHLR